MSENNDLSVKTSDKLKMKNEDKFRLEMLHLIKAFLPDMSDEERELFQQLFLKEKMEKNHLFTKLKELQ